MVEISPTLIKQKLLLIFLGFLLGIELQQKLSYFLSSFLIVFEQVGLIKTAM